MRDVFAQASWFAHYVDLLCPHLFVSFKSLSLVLNLGNLELEVCSLQPFAAPVIRASKAIPLEFPRNGLSLLQADTLVPYQTTSHCCGLIWHSSHSLRGHLSSDGEVCLCCGTLTIQ